MPSRTFLRSFADNSKTGFPAATWHRKPVIFVYYVCILPVYCLCITTGILRVLTCFYRLFLTMKKSPQTLLLRLFLCKVYDKFVTYAMLPTCYLPVTYSPIFYAFYDFSHHISIFFYKAQKSTAILKITVLSSLPALLTFRVYLELAFLGCFLHGNLKA